MVQDGNQALVPRYAAIYKQNNAKSPLAGLYSQNPYVNGRHRRQGSLCRPEQRLL